MRIYTQDKCAYILRIYAHIYSRYMRIHTQNMCTYPRYIYSRYMHTYTQVICVYTQDNAYICSRYMRIYTQDICAYILKIFADVGKQRGQNVDPGPIALLYISMIIIYGPGRGCRRRRRPCPGAARAPPAPGRGRSPP
jgi:hypothetical protein